MDPAGIGPGVDWVTRAADIERADPRGLPRIRRLGAGMALLGVVLAAAVRVWGSADGSGDAWNWVAVTLVYIGLVASWHRAVDRVSDRPTVWFTAAVPALVAVQAVAVEAVNALGVAFDTSAVSMLMVLVAVPVALVGAHLAKRPWKSGLMAWCLALCHLGISVGALAGIPLGTFGDATRSDELLVWGAALPLLAIALALPFAPHTRRTVRIAGPLLVAAALPAALLSGTLVAGLALLAALTYVVAEIGHGHGTASGPSPSLRRGSWAQI